MKTNTSLVLISLVTLSLSTGCDRVNQLLLPYSSDVATAKPCLDAAAAHVARHRDYRGFVLNDLELVELGPQHYSAMIYYQMITVSHPHGFAPQRMVCEQRGVDTELGLFIS